MYRVGGVNAAARPWPRRSPRARARAAPASCAASVARAPWRSFGRSGRDGSRSSSPDKTVGSIRPLQLDPLVILLEDLLIRRPVQRHSVGADLAHADAVAPAAAEKRHAEDDACGVPLDVVREQTVPQAEQ